MYLPDFFWKYRRPIILIVLLCLSFLFMIDSLQRRWVERAAGEIVLDAASPVQRVSKGIYDGGRNALSVIPDFFRARSENILLRKRAGELEQEIVHLREQMLEEQRLRELFAFSAEIVAPKVVARVIGRNPTAWFNTVIVDKGTSDDIRPNLPAVSSSGLVGCVIEARRYSSKVLLLTDSNSRVGVISQRGRAQGIVQGDNDGGCVLKYLETTADIRDGDVLITSGNSQIYPKGLLVGHVAQLEKKAGNLFQWARVVPATDLGKLEEIIIIISEPEPEGILDSDDTDKAVAQQ